MENMDKWGEPKAGSAGLVPTTAANDLMHSTSLGRSAKITKVMAYNDTGANVTLQFGTLDRQAIPAFVQLLPELVAQNTLDNEWTEWDLPAVEFAPNTALLAAGRTGNIYVLASAALVDVVIEVKEKGA